MESTPLMFNSCLVLAEKNSEHYNGLLCDMHLYMPLFVEEVVAFFVEIAVSQDCNYKSRGHLWKISVWTDKQIFIKFFCNMVHAKIISKSLLHWTNKIPTSLSVHQIAILQSSIIDWLLKGLPDSFQLAFSQLWMLAILPLFITRGTHNFITKNLFYLLNCLCLCIT